MGSRRLTRRAILAGGASAISGLAAAWGAAAPPARISSKSRDVIIRDIAFDFEDFRYRSPYAFGGESVERTTLLNVHITVEAAKGRLAKGFGSMPLGNVWAYPSRTLAYGQTMGAMKALATRIARITHQYTEQGHPIAINRELEKEYIKTAAELSQEPGIDQPIPKLAVLVTASAFDAAIHDAYGKAHNCSTYRAYGPEYLRRDLSQFLGSDFKGENLDRYILKDPKPRLVVSHSVGSADAMTEADLQSRLNDGLPETLPGWIALNGIHHFDIKLHGTDVNKDIDRILQVDRVVAEAQQKRGVQSWQFGLDFSGRCASEDYLLEILGKLKETAPAAFERIQYVEQPTPRDLAAHRSNTLHRAAKLRPMVADESVTDLESLLLAREMGYTGVALRACQGPAHTILMAAAAQKFGMFLCVQDLTCPGASLIHSASIAARIPGADTIEANARQYIPAANKAWASKFPGIFAIKDGTMDTSSLTTPGLGAV